MNRQIMGGITGIALLCFAGTWGVLLLILWRTGHGDLALGPTVVFALIGIGLWNRAREESNAPDQRTCPDCAEEILPEARVCKHCGYRFAPPTARPDL